ncbi:MAG TPA: glutaredoxin family protein [Nitrospiraceae bacterium]|nr:glutaredoxin family protein [Nitrospiraceae bacterium]
MVGRVMEFDLHAQPGIQVYTATRCGDCQMAKAVLDRAGADYEQIDIDGDPAAADIVVAINGGYRTVPTIIFPDGRVLVEPRPSELLTALGQSTNLEVSDEP